MNSLRRKTGNHKDDDLGQKLYEKSFELRDLEVASPLTTLEKLMIARLNILQMIAEIQNDSRRCIVRNNQKLGGNRKVNKITTLQTMWDLDTAADVAAPTLVDELLLEVFEKDTIQVLELALNRLDDRIEKCQEECRRLWGKLSEEDANGVSLALVGRFQESLVTIPVRATELNRVVAGYKAE